MKLELKHLAPYLPYGLKAVCEGLSGEKTFHIYTIEHDTITSSGVGLNTALKNGFTFSVKPILRPLSDLTKEIEHNGEKFIPLLELRSIEQGNWDDGEFFLNHTQITDYGVRNAEYEGPVYWVEWQDGLSQTQSFSFKSNNFHRVWIRDRKKLGGVEGGIVENQLQLFQKLFEWHFDVFGLIDAGLAIDINTLKGE